MDYKALADLLFSDVVNPTSYYEKLYPKRDLPEGAIVARIAPSPTGFIHLGNLFNAIIGERLAHQSSGVFFLRIEDTDQKREVPNAISVIHKMMNYYDICFDEGRFSDSDKGNYGPYKQRDRALIYHTYAKELVEKGLAYPCFCEEDYLDNIRKIQSENKEEIGYYGKYAICHELTYEDIKKKIENHEPYVIRFRASLSKINETIEIPDGIKGVLKFKRNIIDFVLLKRDGIPTYHFAHAVDDHLMHTTHVTRGEEWISSLPIHYDLFEALGFTKPIYCHTPLLMKQDGEIRRKFSKRKDPEFSLEFYQKAGYTKEAVWVYLLSVLNSNFEEWWNNNKTESYLNFKFTIQHLSRSGALFDQAKLDYLSKEILSLKSSAFIYEELLSWALQFDKSFSEILINKKELAYEAISLGRNDKNPRKDIHSFSQAREFYSFYFDEIFERSQDTINLNKEMQLQIINEFATSFSFNDDASIFSSKIKEIAVKHNFCIKMKEYQATKDSYNGAISDIYELIRIMVTGRKNSPDIYSIIHVLGENTTRNRINSYINLL